MFESELVANAAAGIDDQRDGQGKIGFTTEVCDGLTLFVLEDSEIVFSQICNKFSLFVRNREENIDEVDVYRNCLVVSGLGRRFRELRLLRTSLRYGKSRQSHYQHQTLNKGLHR